MTKSLAPATMCGTCQINRDMNMQIRRLIHNDQTRMFRYERCCTTQLEPIVANKSTTTTGIVSSRALRPLKPKSRLIMRGMNVVLTAVTVLIPIEIKTRSQDLISIYVSRT
jgi:hypothetical protein